MTQDVAYFGSGNLPVFANNTTQRITAEMKTLLWTILSAN